MSTNPSASDRAPLYRAKIAHLDALIADLDRDWKRLPKLFLPALASIPVTFIYGLLWGFLVVVATASFVSVVAYITRVRRLEYSEERDQIFEELGESEPTTDVAGRVDADPTLG